MMSLPLDVVKGPSAAGSDGKRAAGFHVAAPFAIYPSSCGPNLIVKPPTSIWPVTLA